MKRAARVDANHAEIVRALRSAGMKAVSLASMGKGIPDLIVGYRGRNVLLEIKDGAKVRSAQALTVDEANWIATWPGQVAVVRSPEEAINAVLVAVGCL